MIEGLCASKQKVETKYLPTAEQLWYAQLVCSSTNRILADSHEENPPSVRHAGMSYGM